jgi:cytohesin
MERLGNPQVTPVASPSDVAAMVDVVELLLANGADVKARDGNDVTPLHLAAATGQPTLIEMLIAKGANINARSKEGVTPLYVAAKLDRARAAETLIAHGAEIDARTVGGHTALASSAAEGHRGPAELLVAHGADVNVKDHTGKTPLVWALSAAALVSPSGQKIASSMSAERSAAEKQKLREIAKNAKGQWREIAILLIRHGAQTNPGPESDQPLFLAALIGDAELVTELVEHGAEINDAKGGETALHCAIAERHKEAATVLINKGASLNAQSIRRGLTPLHFLAGIFDDGELAELMIQRGANVNARDKQGITPLRYALVAKNNQVADVLKRNGGR